MQLFTPLPARVYPLPTPARSSGLGVNSAKEERTQESLRRLLFGSRKSFSCRKSSLLPHSLTVSHSRSLFAMASAFPPQAFVNIVGGFVSVLFRLERAPLSSRRGSGSRGCVVVLERIREPCDGARSGGRRARRDCIFFRPSVASISKPRGRSCAEPRSSEGLTASSMRRFSARYSTRSLSVSPSRRHSSTCEPLLKLT